MKREAESKEIEHNKKKIGIIIDIFILDWGVECCLLSIPVLNDNETQA